MSGSLRWFAGFIGCGVALVGGLGLTGCAADDPAFKVADLAAAPGLVGKWEGIGPKGERAQLTIAESKQRVSGERLAGRDTGVTRAGDGEPATVYMFHYVSADAQQAQGARAADVIDARVYVLKETQDAKAGTWIACVQFENGNNAPSLAAPAFNTLMFVRLQLLDAADNDRDKTESLTIAAPVVSVTLAPALKLLDPPQIASADAPAPTVEAALKPGDNGQVAGVSLLTTDPDRAVGVIRRYGGQAGFWSEPMRFAKVK